MPADWRDIPGDSKEKYSLYLCSREWAEKREEVRRRSDGICERCFYNPMDACRHLTYERKYCEELDDLQAICSGCHNFTHGKSDEDPARGRVVALALNDDSEVLCPICGFNYCHPDIQTVLDGDKAIGFWGECCHNFFVVFRCRKGNTEVVCYYEPRMQLDSWSWSCCVAATG